MIYPILWAAFIFIMYRASISRHALIRISGVLIGFTGMMVSMLMTLGYFILGVEL